MSQAVGPGNARKDPATEEGSCGVCEPGRREGQQDLTLQSPLGVYLLSSPQTVPGQLEGCLQGQQLGSVACDTEPGRALGPRRNNTGRSLASAQATCWLSGKSRLLSRRASWAWLGLQVRQEWERAALGQSCADVAVVDGSGWLTDERGWTCAPATPGGVGGSVFQGSRPCSGLQSWVARRGAAPGTSPGGHALYSGCDGR